MQRISARVECIVQHCVEITSKAIESQRSTSACSAQPIAMQQKQEHDRTAGITETISNLPYNLKINYLPILPFDIIFRIWREHNVRHRDFWLLILFSSKSCHHIYMLESEHFTSIIIQLIDSVKTVSWVTFSKHACGYHLSVLDMLVRTCGTPFLQKLRWISVSTVTMSITRRCRST